MAFTFTPLQAVHLPMLSAWLATPHVHEWWPEACDLVSVTTRYLPIVEGIDPTEAFLVSLDGVPIGYVQAYRLADEPAWRATISAAIDVGEAVGIDYLIGRADAVGRGLGSRMLREFVESRVLVDGRPGTVVVAVQQANVASWWALERAGFRRAWSGALRTDDPSDQGPAYLYVRERRAD